MQVQLCVLGGTDSTQLGSPFYLDVAKIALKKQQRESEEEDAEAGIAEQEEDRSGLVGARRMRRKFEGAAPLITVLRRSVGARQAVPRQT